MHNHGNVEFRTYKVSKPQGSHNVNKTDMSHMRGEGGRGKAKWGSKRWIINQLKSEVEVLLEQVVIDLGHDFKVPVYWFGL